MHEHVDDLLPFYLNETLPVEKREAVDAHLAICPQCQRAIGEWETLAGGVHSAAPPLRAEDFPALSPVVRATLQGRPSLPEAILTTTNLIGAQRIFLRGTWLIQTMSTILLIAVLAPLLLPVKNGYWAVIPFIILVPFFAVLGVSVLEIREDDLADEIVAATPTHPGVLVFARLTLAVSMITGVALLGSLLISGLGGFSLFQVVAAWLGPMLWLSALTTLLALLWHPWIAAGSAIALWGGILLLLVIEGSGRPLLAFSLAPLLSPSWASFGLQAFLAAALWLASWLWLVWGAPPALRLESAE